MMELYKVYPDKDRFFDNTQSKAMGRITTLIGNNEFTKQLKEGWSETKILKTWEPGLNKYKKMRKQYMLYP